MNHRNRAFRALLDQRLKEHFWPIRQMTGSWKPWGIGVNQHRPRKSGRLWTLGYDRMTIGVSVAYQHGNLAFFKVSDNPATWDRSITRAFCWLSQHMTESGVEWVTPGLMECPCVMS